MKPLKQYIKAFGGLMIALACISTTSCDRLHEDLQPCISGVKLRFIDEMTLDEGNIVYSQVDHITLLIYDEDGKYLMTRSADMDDVRNENWRMEINLPAGYYRMLAYGDVDYQESSFSFVTPPKSTPMQDLELRLDPRFTSPDNDKPITHLYYGALNLDIPEPGIDTGLTEATVRMMRDTNDIRILLANADGKPTDEADFEFNIITDNTVMNYQNDLVPAGLSTYWPWVRGNAEMGMLDSEEPAVVSYAELSIARLVVGNPTTLLITRKSDGKEVVKIPLINLLMLYKSERFASWDSQRFLDSESRWVVTFFLTGDDVWLQTKIVVNDWVVRINDISEL